MQTAKPSTRTGGAPRKFTPEQEKAIATDYANVEMTIRQIEEKWGTTKPTIYAISERQGTKRPAEPKRTAVISEAA